MRGVGEEVERGDRRDPVARVQEAAEVPGEGGRVAGDVDDNRGAEGGGPVQGLGRQADAGRIDDDDVGRLAAGLREQGFDRAGQELDVLDPVDQGVLHGVGDVGRRGVDGRHLPALAAGEASSIAPLPQ